ncbi:hypothetical protein GCK72_010543 [Caenorhabditis remanei]|uniref:Uncharacterized protein n=1 Tax=Caenorhabditis remanei TaxID=31234 RepID=A0A6A5H5R3_CAERE|nr:hypothetical protein GCK72_010543 [Caenorhabditis remanei]KAF1762281.1 hypothetical protein GCK72_010543 [Caenorhabditis remanei]
MNIGNLTIFTFAELPPVLFSPSMRITRPPSVMISREAERPANPPPTTTTVGSAAINGAITATENRTQFIKF